MNYLKQFYLVLAAFLLLLGCDSEKPKDLKIDLTKHNVNYDSKVTGMNFDYKSFDMHPDFISTLPLTMEITANVDGEILDLVSGDTPTLAGSSCSGPCNRITHIPMNCSVKDGAADCGLKILRFSQSGEVDTKRGKVSWLIEMEEGANLLAGTLSTKLDEEGALTYPGKMLLGGKMKIFLKSQRWGKTFKLVSKKEPILSGIANSWPPKSSVLTLENPPIKYYKEKDIDDPKAAPFLVVTKNQVKLGNKKSDFLSKGPVINKLEYVNHEGVACDIQSKECAGVKISWKTDKIVTKNFNISHYNIYRNYLGRDPEGWKLIAKSSASATNYIDKENNLKQDAYYAITHSMPVGFDKFYEGMYLNDPPQIKVAGLNN